MAIFVSFFKDFVIALTTPSASGSGRTTGADKRPALGALYRPGQFKPLELQVGFLNRSLFSVKCDNEKKEAEEAGDSMFGRGLVHSWQGFLGAGRFAEQQPSQQWSSKRSC